MYIKINKGKKIEDFKGKKIILFGASSTGKKALEEFERVNADIIGFCDNGIDKWGSIFERYNVYSPTILKKMTDEISDMCVIITSTYEKEISAQLENMEIKNVYIAHMGVLYEKMGFKYFQNTVLARDDANNKIIDMIESGEPFFIGRIGSTELETICNYKYFTQYKLLLCSGSIFSIT